MSDPVRRIAKSLEVEVPAERIGRSWTQGNVPVGEAGRQRARSAGRKGTLGSVRRQALEAPATKMGDQEYVTDVAAFLRQMAFSSDPYSRAQAVDLYRSLEPAQRQAVDALIVAAMPNARGQAGLSPDAQELFRTLNGEPLSPERARAVREVEAVEGYEVDQRRPDAPQTRNAPPDRMPADAGRSTDLIRRGIRDRIIAQNPDLRGADLQRAVNEEMAKLPRERPIATDVEKRPGFRGPANQQISVSDEGYVAPALTTEQRIAARNAFPGMWEKKRAEYRQFLKAPTANKRGKTARPISDEEVEAAVLRRFPDLTPAEMDAEIDRIVQSVHEGRNYSRSVSSDQSQWRTDPTTGAQISRARPEQDALDAFDRAVKARDQGAIAEAEARLAALYPDRRFTGRHPDELAEIRSGLGGRSARTSADYYETPESEHLYRNFTHVMGYDPRITPQEFNSARSGGRPSQKPENINTIGGRAADDTFAVDDSSVIDSGVNSRDEFDAESLATDGGDIRGMEASGGKAKPKRASGKGAMQVRNLAAGDIENLYKRLLKAAGAKNPDDMVTPPAAQGFTSPRDMADFTLRVLQNGGYDIPPSMRESVTAELAGVYANRWGEDLGLSSLGRRGGQPVKEVSLRDAYERLLAGESSGLPAQGPAKQATARQLDAEWNNESVQQARRSQRALKRQEELAQEVASWPEGVESVEVPPRSLGDDSDDYRALFGAAPEEVRAQSVAPTQVGKPDEDVVTTAPSASSTDDINAALAGAADDIPGESSGLALPAGTPADRGGRKPRAPRAPRQPRQAQQNTIPQQYINQARMHGTAINTAPQGSPKFLAAQKFFEDAKRQFDNLQSQGADKAFLDAFDQQILSAAGKGISLEGASRANAVPASPAPSPTPATATAPTPPPVPEAVPGDLTTGTPDRPIDPLESASQTDVGTPEGPSVEAAQPQPTMADAVAAVRDRQDQVRRAVAAFAASRGRAPNQQEMRLISQALDSGRMEDGPLQPWLQSVVDFSETAQGNRQAAARTTQQVEIDALNRQLSQPGLEELPLPEARSSAQPRAAAATTEQAAKNVDASKATKDAESDKATQVTKQAAAEADAEAAAKRQEDAANAQSSPQTPKAGQSKGPGVAARAGQAASWVANAPYNIAAGAVGGAIGGFGGGVKYAAKNLPPVLLGAWGLHELNKRRDSWMPGVPEGARPYIEPVLDAGSAVAQGAYDLGAGVLQRAREAEQQASAGPTDMPVIPAGFSGPGPQGFGPAAPAQDMGPMGPGADINMMPPGLSPGDGSQASLERIRRIISTTRPSSRHQPGTLQRASTYYE